MPHKSQLEQIEAIYRSAPIGLCVLDRDLRYISINDRLAAINGRPPQDHIGLRIRDVLPDVADVIEPPLRSVLEEGSPITDLEFQSRGRTVRCQCLPLRDEARGIIGINIVAEDVTERTRMEQALRDSEERFRALADNIPQLAYMVDATGSVFWYNQRWFEYTGMEFEEAQGRGWERAHHPDHLPRVLERVRQCLATGEAWEDTFPLRGRDGTYRWFLSRAVPIRGDQGRINVWFGTSTDVTEQRQSEDVLREAHRLKDHFLAFLAHELRAPLAPILTAAKILELKAPADAALQNVSSVIVRQTAQLSRLVDDLLDLARIAAGKLELRKKPVEVNAIIAHAVEACTPFIKERRHTLRVSGAELPIFVDADDSRIVQVVSNLLNNAAKYMAEGGVIDLQVSDERGAAVIRVRDHGVGIPPQMLGQIFDRFVQIDATRDRAQGGLGIGLSVVKSLVDMHGGSVEARSDGPGQGAEFTVRLPLAQAVSASR